MKNASRPARRHLAAGALAAVALLGATGCSAVSPIATTDRLGFIGRREGLVGIATALVVPAA